MTRTDAESQGKVRMQAELRIQADDKTSFLADALRPEVQDEISRSEVSLEKLDGELVIRFRAEDVVALRAALNSYLRWAKLAMDTENAVEMAEKP